MRAPVLPNSRNTVTESGSTAAVHSGRPDGCTGGYPVRGTSAMMLMRPTTHTRRAQALRVRNAGKVNSYVPTKPAEKAGAPAVLHGGETGCPAPLLHEPQDRHRWTPAHGSLRVHLPHLHHPFDQLVRRQPEKTHHAVFPGRARPPLRVLTRPADAARCLTSGLLVLVLVLLRLVRLVVAEKPSAADARAGLAGLATAGLGKVPFLPSHGQLAPAALGTPPLLISDGVPGCRVKHATDAGAAAAVAVAVAAAVGPCRLPRQAYLGRGSAGRHSRRGSVIIVVGDARRHAASTASAGSRGRRRCRRRTRRQDRSRCFPHQRERRRARRVGGVERRCQGFFFRRRGGWRGGRHDRRGGRWDAVGGCSRHRRGVGRLGRPPREPRHRHQHLPPKKRGRGVSGVGNGGGEHERTGGWKKMVRHVCRRLIGRQRGGVPTSMVVYALGAERNHLGGSKEARNRRNERRRPKCFISCTGRCVWAGGACPVRDKHRAGRLRQRQRQQIHDSSRLPRPFRTRRDRRYVGEWITILRVPGGSHPKGKSERTRKAKVNEERNRQREKYIRGPPPPSTWRYTK